MRRGLCKRCAAPMRSQANQWVCGACLALEQPELYCDLCARVHRNLWVCIERLERASAAYRAWLYGGPNDAGDD